MTSSRSERAGAERPSTPTKTKLHIPSPFTQLFGFKTKIFRARLEISHKLVRFAHYFAKGEKSPKENSPLASLGGFKTKIFQTNLEIWHRLSDLSANSHAITTFGEIA